MFERSVGKKPVPYIASSRTSTGGIIWMCPCLDGRVDREAVEREREQGGVADQVPEARAGEARGALHLEAADLGVLGARRPGLADAAELLGVLVGVAVGRGGVGRVRHLLEEAVALGFGGGELLLRGLELLLHAVQLLELLRRRLALQLQLAAELVHARDELAPALVGGEQRVERLRGALAQRARRGSRRGRCARARRSITRGSLDDARLARVRLQSDPRLRAAHDRKAVGQTGACP